jgi:hypothetical protein
VGWGGGGGIKNQGGTYRVRSEDKPWKDAADKLVMLNLENELRKHHNTCSIIRSQRLPAFLARHMEGRGMLHDQVTL